MSYIDEGYRNSYKYDIKKWGEIKKGYTHFSQNDIALAKITPCFQNRKSLIFHQLKNGFGAGTTELHVIRPLKLYKEYLLLFFKTEHFISRGVNNFTGTAGQQRINKTFLENFLIPIPPFNEEKKIIKKVIELFNTII